MTGRAGPQTPDGTPGGNGMSRDARVPRCFPTLQPALYIARGLAAAAAGSGTGVGAMNVRTLQVCGDATLNLQPFALGDVHRSP